MSDQQLEMETRYICPTCRGNKQMLRLLYPDEALAQGKLTEVCMCRTCRGEGSLLYDPNDKSEIPY